MIEIYPPNWLLAGAFVLLGVLLVAWLKLYLRGKEVWRYDTRAAWLRGFAYFSFAWALAAASGTLNTIVNNPVVFPGQGSDLWWLLFTALLVVVIVVGYGVVWPRGTKPHGRRLTVDSVVFGAFWGISEGLLFGSVWVLAVRLWNDWGEAANAWKDFGVVITTIIVLSAFVGAWHALYWDVHISPEHNIIEWNPKKVMLAHNPNVILSAIYVTAWGNLTIYVLLQAAALFMSSVAMPFPSARYPHPPDPTRPELGPPVPIGTTDMTGKVVVVTGGAGGIGSVICRRLAAVGARVVILDIDVEGANRVAADIRSATGATVDVIETDLGDRSAVRTLAGELESRYPRIDVLVNNAGVFKPTYAENADGVEQTLAVNHLGHFLLTNLLLDRLTESRARVVFVSSDAHWQAKGVDWDDLNCRQAWKGKPTDPNGGFAAYNQSKLIVCAVAMELAERTEGTGVTVNVVAPGALVPTGIYDELTGPPAFFIKVLRPVLRTPFKASQGSVYLASSPEVEGVSGWYWKDVRAIDESQVAQDRELRARLWDWSTEAAGLAGRPV